MTTGTVKADTPVVAWPGHASISCTVPIGTAVHTIDENRWVISDDRVAAKITKQPALAAAYYVYVPATAIRRD